VRAELDPRVIQGQGGERVDLGDSQVIQGLVDKGLRARLRMQSLLTGQLYVDLDVYPDRPARLLNLDPGVSEIPTIPTAVDELTSHLNGFPIEKFLADAAAISKSVKTILASVAERDLPARLEATLIHLESLATALDTRGEPILEEIEINLAAMKEAISATREAMHSVGEAADQIGALAAPDSSMITTMNRASQELTGAAQAVRKLAEEGSPTVHGLNSVLQEIARAARALRVLAETLERQPEAILRGKR